MAGEVLLVGAGHAHLGVIRRWARRRDRPFGVTIVAPGAFWYSGTATAMLGGAIRPGACRLPIAPIAERAGFRFVNDRAIGLDPEAKTVTLASGAIRSYDVASLDLGSVVPVDAIPGMAEHARPLKPIRAIAELREELERRFRRPVEVPLRVAIVGGGASACEVAANLSRLADRHGAAVAIELIHGADRLLPRFPGGASAAVDRALRERGIAVRSGTRVVQVGADRLSLDIGETTPFDVAIAATGLVPDPFVRRIGPPVDADGALLVDEHLRSIGSPGLFGGGDCVAMRGFDLPRIGVVAVRQAPVLAHNLAATLEGRPLRRYRPQRDWLLILNLGDGTGLACRGPYWFRGRPALWWKWALDRGFLGRHRG